MSFPNVGPSLPSDNPPAADPRCRQESGTYQHVSRRRVRLTHVGPPLTRKAGKDADTCVCHYPDKAQIWTRLPLVDEQWALVKAACGSTNYRNWRRRDDPRWCHRYQLNQPKPEALAQFRHVEHRINWVEFARDLSSETMADTLAQDEFIHCHLRVVGKDPEYPVHKYSHGALTRYTGAKGEWPSNQLVTYIEDHGRITGELNCNHWEWRTKGTKFVKRKGVRTVDDLINFDHEAFWARILREVYLIDLDRLGRIMRNKAKGTKSKKPIIVEWIKGLPFSLDKKLGNLIARACVRTLPNVRGRIRGIPCIVQDLVDKHGMKLIRPALRRVPIPVHGHDGMKMWDVCPD